ncbi:MAG: hypothetical protein JO218_11400 [Burkholderiales bacterium]|nr:hypothetical protein [Burkholderiales bacterium]
MRSLLLRLANVRMLVGMRLRHLRSGNRQLLYRHRHAMFFSAAPAGYLLLHSPDVVAAPVMPFAQAAPAPTLTTPLFIYLILCAVWLAWQARILAADTVAAWCRHLPIARSEWRVSQIVVALGALGPLWLPWLLAPSMLRQQHAAVDLPHYLSALGLFSAAVALLVIYAGGTARPLLKGLRHHVPIVDLQLGILLDRHKTSLLVRQGLMLGTILAMHWLWQRPDGSVIPAVATVVGLGICVILDGGVMVILGSAHQSADAYFGHLPGLGRRTSGDIAISLAFLLPPMALAIGQLIVSGTGLGTIAAVAGLPIVAAAAGALPAVSRTGDRRLLWWVATVATHTILAYQVSP